MRKPIDLLQVYGKFGAEQRISLRDPVAKAAFGTHATEAIEKALADDRLVHGQRIEAMFEALLVSLGEYRLFKVDDTGQVFSDEGLRAADYRIVLKDEVQWLVEVKNHHADDPEEQKLILKPDYLRSLRDYAAATGGELRVAVFWSRWQVWTLVDPDRFADARGEVSLEMFDCVKANELARLGDRTVGTRPPLRLRLEMDAEQTSDIGRDGKVEAVIKGSRFFSDEIELNDPIDKEIAWIFMLHGDWCEHGPEPIIEADRLVALEFRWEPAERANPDENFEMIGSLSRMFSRYFAEHTVKDREVVRLHAPLRPGWFAPLVQRDRPKSALPLWLFELRPVYPDTHGSTS